jgi:hypothetical protein
VTYQDAPRKGATHVDISVWIPKDVARQGIDDIADYLDARLGWQVYRSLGWSSGALLGEDEMTTVIIPVRAREIRAALTAKV